MYLYMLYTYIYTPVYTCTADCAVYVAVQTFGGSLRMAAGHRELFICLLLGLGTEPLKQQLPGLFLRDSARPPLDAL